MILYACNREAEILLRALEAEANRWYDDDALVEQIQALIARIKKCLEMQRSF